MPDSIRLGRARSSMLPVAFVSAALLAMLVIAPFASAASDPISSGTTTLTINGAFDKQAKKAGITLAVVKPSKLKGNKLTFPVSGGEIEPTSGAAVVTHGGGLKIGLGNKSVALRSLMVSTTAKSLSAKIGGKTVKVGNLAGTSFARLGFGASVTAKKVKLTGAAAKLLNKKLAPPSSHSKGKKTTKLPPPFKANQVLGSTITEVEPETVNVLPTGNVTFAGNTTLLTKLAAVETKVETISPTTAAANVFTSPLSGGTISPLGTSGSIDSSGGLKLVQKLEGGPTTTITLGSIGADLAAKTASAEVIGESNAKEGEKMPLNLGTLPRTSIADLTTGSVTPSPATRTVAVTASATIQPLAAEVLNGFVKVYQGYYEQVLMAKSGKTPAEAKAAAEAKVAPLQIRSGEELGSFSFTATGG